MAKSTKSKSRPSKPRPDFPLFPHASGRWAKKIRGAFAYFGKVADDPKGEKALALWLDQKDELLAGRKPRPKTDDGRLTVRDLCNRFLSAKVKRLQEGLLSPATFADAKETTDRIVRVFGKSRSVEDLDGDDFAELRADIAKTRNPESVGNEINRVRSVFKFAWENRKSTGLAAPVEFGTEFARPSRRVLRTVRNGRPQKFFEAAEVRAMLDAAGQPMRAMILLGVNGGLGNSDIGKLPASALNLEAGWLDYPRPKTGVCRRIPLWVETVAAIQEWLPMRPKPRDDRHADLVFITSHGGAWAKDLRELDTSNGFEDLQKQCRKSADNPISKEMRKLMDSLNITRAGVSFYSLRHVFETIGGESRDQVAVDFIMGHADESMADRYRERISDDRLQAVVEHVRKWLFPTVP